MSIRFRLTAWYAAILTAGLALFGGLIWLSLRHRLLDEMDQDLAGRAVRFEKYFREEAGNPGELNEFCQALPPHSFIDVHGSKGFTFRFASSSPDLRLVKRQFLVNGEAFDVELGTSMSGVEHTLDLVRLLLLSLSPLVIGIACAGGWWLSGRALKPVKDITAAAMNISIENLSRRLPVPATGDELADLTEVLNSMLARLESAVKTLSQFVADASHEFRTPLAVIRTTAELALRRARSPEAYRDSLQEIGAEAERMTVLVEDLLILARGDAGVADMPLSPVDLSEVLQDVLGEMRNLADFRGVSIRPKLSKVMIPGNRAALHRAFLVLLDNALKYSAEGSEVVVALTDNCIEIKDFGTGIHPGDLPHIFKRFYQADRARSQGGYGLGLSLAQTIVHAHGGVIEVSSVLGEGSSFRVILNGAKKTIIRQKVTSASS
jgi:signal transduction histidine kinase